MVENNREKCGRCRVAYLVGTLSVLTCIAMTSMSVVQCRSAVAIENRTQLILLDVASLTSDYANEQLRNGTWPDAESLYAITSKLLFTKSLEESRVDIFQHMPNGPWLQFELTQADDPRIRVKIIWDKAELSNLVVYNRS